MKLKLGSLYSGAIDAFAYAAKQLEIEVSWQVERRKQAHRYLNKNYPESQKYYYDGNIGKHNLEWVHIIAGGDPCQPHSNAGLRKGKADDRYRWPEMFRICKELRPDWIINENVAGSVSNMVLDQKITDLESIGYSWQAYNIPAIAVGAHHERQRIFLIANSDAQRWGELLCDNAGAIFETGRKTITLGASGNPFLQFEERTGEPAIFPMAHGIPDHIFRLGAAGDSIVSPIPLILFTCIKEIYKIQQ